MWGVMVNTLAILTGTIAGLVLKKILNKAVQEVLMQAMGIAVLVIGIMDAMVVTGNIPMILTLILSLTVGGAIGSLLRIQYGIERFSEFLQKKLSKNENSTIGKAFSSSVLIFCVGAMVVYGSINSGLGDYSTLYVKAILDGTMAMILAAGLGGGVALSAIPVFVMQGSIALCAGLLNPIMTACPEIRTMLSGIGGVLVMCIGINLLEIKKIRTADMLPAIFGCFIMLLIF